MIFNPNICCTIALTSLFIYIATLRFWSRWSPQSKLSCECKPIPGPKGLPWIGPIHLIPRFGSWFAFAKWKEFGPLYEITLLGQKHVFLTKESLASEMLLARSKIYSNRPSIPTLLDSQCQGTSEIPKYLPLMSKNLHHTRQKKFGHISLVNAARQDFYQFPSIEAKRSIFKMMIQGGSSWQEITEDMTSRIASRLAWGSPDSAEELRRDAWNLLTHISPAAFLTNILPQLLWLPKFLCPWKRAESKRLRLQTNFFLKQMREVQKKISSQSACPSYMRNYLIGGSDLTNDIEAAFAVGMLAVTAIFTISSPMQTFVRAAALHPQWLKKVQDELDSAVGPDRMPEVSDAPNLPLLRAFIKEGLRWRPPIPTGIPHELEQDDILNGYFLPKGTRIHPVEYAFCRDAETYPDPDRFNPERWILANYKETYKEPLSKYPTIIGFSSFGWGRRSCLGQTLTWHELLCFCGGLAWAFDIKVKSTMNERRLKDEANCQTDDGSFEMELPANWDESLIIVRPRGPEVLISLRDENRGEILKLAYEGSKEADILGGTFKVQ